MFLPMPRRRNLRAGAKKREKYVAILGHLIVPRGTGGMARKPAK